MNREILKGGPFDGLPVGIVGDGDAVYLPFGDQESGLVALYERLASRRWVFRGLVPARFVTDPQPRSLRQLLAYLSRFPRVRQTAAGLLPYVLEFECYDRGRIWWSDGSYLPVWMPGACKVETGLVFDALGFSLQRGAVVLRYDYLP